MPPPPCLVLHCSGQRSDPGHEVRTNADDDPPRVAPVCPEHWAKINGGEPWLWVPGHGLKGAGSTLGEGAILMDDDLASYALVVDADVQVSSSQVFSPDIAEGKETRTLIVNGRVFGAPEHVSIELALGPETVKRLRESLRFFPV